MNSKRTAVISLVAFVLSVILAVRAVILPKTVQAAPAGQASLTATSVIISNIASDTTWTAGNVYYILSDVSVNPGVTLTIEGGAIVKFWVPLDPSIATDLTGLRVEGTISVVPGPVPGAMVIFTSGRDDSAGGDTNSDGAQTLPAPGDWDYLQFPQWSAGAPPVENLEIRFSKDGLNFHNTTTNNYAPVASNNLLDSNTCGITFSLTNSGSVGGEVSNNTFTHNKYGFCTRRPLDTGSGILNPALLNNIFSNNSILPVYLFGNSYPTYSGNTFTGYIDPADRLGIGLGGDFTASGSLIIVDNMPFVLVAPLEVEGGTTNVNVPAGAVFKGFTSAEMARPTDPLPTFKMSGNVTFLSTPAAPIIFTSYHDDTVGGDTNGDNSDTEGYAGDWGGVYFRDTNVEAAANYTFHDLVIKHAVNGFIYENTLAGTRAPTFDHLTFDGNKNGLRLKALSANTNSRITPFIQNSTFTNHGIIPSVKAETEPGVPIFLENVVQPTYSNNTFSGNLHPAIGIAGRWRWPLGISLVKVAGDGLTSLPFLVHGEVWFGDFNASGGIDPNGTVNIPAGSVIKFFYNRLEPNSRGRIRAAEKLVLLGSAEAPIVFTSYFDNAYGGNTSATPTLPAASDWWEVLIRQPETAVADAIFRYGDQALHVENKHATTPFSASITNSVFAFNNYGLYLDIQGNADITSEISGNTFDQNAVGLGTFARNTLTSTPKVMGLSRPIISSNSFTGNTLFPIYLNGSASLEFFDTSNVFSGNEHTAIALGGYFGAVKQDPAFKIILPRIMEGPLAPANTKLVSYVVWAITNFDWQTPTWMDGGLVFKFNKDTSLNFYGKMAMNTNALARNVFTSYRDDTVNGDTNGTPNPNPAPARNDWKGLYLYNPQSAPFLYSTIQYSENGLVIYQHQNNPEAANITFRIAENIFTLNKNGLTLYIAGDWDILSLVENNTFYDNDTGLHTYTEPSINIPHGGTSNPTLRNNDFSENDQFPIYLQGSADPVYDNNAFWNNFYPAIAVGGTWTQNATWTILTALDAGDMPYVVKENLTLELYWYPILVPTIHLPADSVVKFMNDKNLYIFGYLDLQSTPLNQIVFTSFLDDDQLGDTNHDGAPTSIPRTAWKSVWLADFPGKNNTIHDAQFFYATAGVGLYYEGPENTQTATLITDTIFSASHSAVAMVIGWRQVGQTIYGGKGNINATISNVQIVDSNYGLLTIAHDKTTGIINPVLENITFTNIATYPVFMGGTTYPQSWTGLNQVNSAPLSAAGELSSSPMQLDSIADTPAEEASVAGLDQPGYVAALDAIHAGSASLNSVVQPQASLNVASNLHPAIGMAGAWNNAGTLLQVEGVPYAITGNFPLTIIIGNYPQFKPADNVTIGAASPEGAIMAVPAGTVFKAAKDRIIDVKGTLNLLSTDQSPVVFTSIKDDSIAGDTNKDGVTTRPAKGDWGELRLSATNTFHNAVLRYATKGLHIYFEGAVNLNNLSSVSHSSFINNTNGISLTAKDNGDIYSQITDSTFDQNTVHIIGYASDAGKTGDLCVDAHNNDLFGLKASQNGIENNNLNGPATTLLGCPAFPFDATNNYWGDPSGPFHQVLNPLGLGSRVSDRVKFDPWLMAAVKPPALYTISGRVTLTDALGAGLPGVEVTLSGAVPETTALTDAQGYYSFSGLTNGNYMLAPSLAGYAFTPAYLNILLANADAENSDFIATQNLGLAGISVNSVSAFRPLTASPTKCKFIVTIDQPAPSGQSVKVNFATLDQTAIAGVDYTSGTGTLTFTGTTLSLPVDVDVKQTPLLQPTKYFSLILSVPVRGYILVSSGTCTIMTTNLVFLPFVRK